MPCLDAVAHGGNPQDRAASLGYAEIAEWTPLEATDVPGEVSTSITKYWLLP